MSEPIQNLNRSYKDKTVLVYDYGLFIELAVRLAEDFGEVLYYTPWKSGFPLRRDAAIGDGIPQIERVLNFWDEVDDADLIVFPDVYDADLQAELRRQGRRVWGHGYSESLELDRYGTRQLQKSLGVDGPKTERIVGLEKLETYLKAHEEKWLKVSTFRGDMETFHHRQFFTSEPFLTDLKKKYGPLSSTMEFLVEENIEGVEIGYDGFTIDGEFPETALFGYEVKDLGYIGKVKPYNELPKQIKDANAKFSPILKDNQSRGFLSFEMRVLDNGSYKVIDPCMRCGSPPTEVSMECYKNLSDILWSGAEGHLVQPEPTCKFAVMAMIHSSWAVSNWMAIEVPAKVKKWVKFRNLYMDGSKCYFVPQEVALPEIGAVIGLGNTLEEAIDMVDDIAEQVEGYQLEIHNNSFEKAQDAIDEGEKIGIKF